MREKVGSKRKFQRTWPAVLLLLMVASLDVSWGAPKVFVGNRKAGTVSAFDGVTGKLLKVIKVGKDPHDFVATPDKRYVFVTDKGSAQVAVIRADTLEISAMIPVGEAPNHIYLSPDGTTIWVPNDASASVTAIDVATQKVLAHVRTDAGHHKLAFTPDGRFIYVTNMVAGNVSVVDAVNKVLIKSIPAGKGVHGIDYCSETNEVFTCNSGESTLSVIDVATNEHVAKIPFGKRPAQIHFDPHRPHIGYVVSRGDHSLWVLDARKRQPVTTILVDRQPDKFSVEPSHRWMYVSAPASFSVVDLETYQKVASVPLEPPGGEKLSGSSSSAAAPNPVAGMDHQGMDHEGMDHEGMEQQETVAPAASAPPDQGTPRPAALGTAALWVGLGFLGLAFYAYRKFHRNLLAAVLLGLSLVSLAYVWRASTSAPAGKNPGVKAISSESESITIHSYVELSNDGKYLYVPVSAQSAAYVVATGSHRVLARVPLEGGAENIFYLD